MNQTSVKGFAAVQRNLLATYLSEEGVVLSRVAIEAKHNEIPF